MLIRTPPEAIAPQVRAGVDRALEAAGGGDLPAFLDALRSALAPVRAAGWRTADYIATVTAQHDGAFPALAGKV